MGWLANQKVCAHNDPVQCPSGGVAVIRALFILIVAAAIGSAIAAVICGTLTTLGVAVAVAAAAVLGADLASTITKRSNRVRQGF